MSFDRLTFLDQVVAGHRPSAAESLALAEVADTPALMAAAAQIRDLGFGSTITFSKKVFIPLTHLCRDVCHYCTFAKPPKKGELAFMTKEQVLAVAREGARMGCKEALFTLGDKPELRYRAARQQLADMGYHSTLAYLHDMAEAVFSETGLLPHLNPGLLTADDYAMLRPTAPSMGIMLETISDRLCEKGQAHHGSPDKVPARRLETLRLAGEAKVPFTTGILIGIGETRQERIEALLAIRNLQDTYGHIQEVIVQNFRAKPDTKMAGSEEPDLDDLLWTLAVSRIVLGPTMSVQVPPNLNPGVLQQLIDAGINDWGGVSPLTPDFVNPEAPWPNLVALADATADAGKTLAERLTVYPHYAHHSEDWIAPNLQRAVLEKIDGEGLARTEDWTPGVKMEIPAEDAAILETADHAKGSEAIQRIVAKAKRGDELDEAEITRLFAARGPDYGYIVAQADALRRTVVGDTVTYVVNRNINYTNVCYFKCQFCAFSKGKLTENLRGKPYVLDMPEIARRAEEAWSRGATEVCMQGGIHPDYTGENYLEICRTLKAAIPDLHIHAFSPLEVWQGAETLGISLEEFLIRLKDAGLGTLPGTAAEVLDDDVRAVLCPDKINTLEWLEVMETAHKVGFRTTATIMFGHVDRYEHWARHLLRIRRLQARTGGFTEFVPLPFVAMEAPIYLKGKARKGPTFREAILMHAVARLVLHPLIPNIQTSWVKLGPEGTAACLNAGCNDLGGTLMNETITRSAGASFGQELPPQEMESIIRGLGRAPKQRSTAYGPVAEERVQRSFQAAPLADLVQRPAREYERQDSPDSSNGQQQDA